MRAHHGRRTALSLAVALALTGAPATQAATITVGTPAQCDLAAAIESANGDSSVSGCVAGNGADVVQLPAGTMSPTLPLPPIVSTLEIRGDALGTSAIDCGGGGQPIVIGGELIAGTAAPSVVLRRFGVQNCAYVAGAGQLGGGGGAGMGGALFIYDGAVTLDRMRFSNSGVSGGAGSAVIFGGAVGGGGGLHGAGGAGTVSADATGFGSGGGGSGTPATSSPSPGSPAGLPNGGAGGSGGIFPAPPGAGGFGGGGGGGASLTSNQGGQNGGLGGFGGGGGAGGPTSASTTTAFGGNGGKGGFGGGGGGGGGSPLGNPGNGGDGGFGAGGGAMGYFENGIVATVGKSGFGATAATNFSGGTGAALGGAIFVRAGLVDVRNTVFQGNAANGGVGSRLGGAIFVLDQAAVTAHQGNPDGLPGTLPDIGGCGVSFSGNTAASAGATDTNNADLYGASRSELVTPCKDIFMDGFE